MTPTNLLTKLRVEDALTAFVAVVFLAWAGIGGALASLHFGEEQLWIFSFILLPVSILVFLASLRYALGQPGTSAGRFLGESAAVIRDWMPFALFLLFYTTFHAQLWLAIEPHDRDGALLAIDRRILGETPSVWMQSWASGQLTNVLAFCYFMHLVLPPIVAALWYRRDVRVFREFLLSILVAGIIGSIGYLLVPAIGPGLAYPQLFTRTLNGSLYHPLIDAIDRVRAPRDVFPSLHVAVSGLVLWYGARRGKLAFVILLPLVIGNWVSTMYLRYHYAVDVVAGALLVPLSVFVTQKLLAAEARARRSQTR